MKIAVHDEISPLKEVLIHRPGDELSQMTQWQLAHLLFDDLLSPDEAGAEHDLLTEIIRGAGARARSLSDVLEFALKNASTSEIEVLLIDICGDNRTGRQIAAEMLHWPAKSLAASLIHGVKWSELCSDVKSSFARLEAQLRGQGQQALMPVPNIMFMRDPLIPVYDGAIVSAMATSARRREPDVVRFAARFGLGVADDAFIDLPDDAAIEGGDVLVMSRKSVFIGCSERTRADTIEQVAQALFDRFDELERVIAVVLPAQRSMMHLDTVLTHIDHGVFLAYAPVICRRGEGAAQVVELTRDTPPRHLDKASPADLLREEFVDVEVIPCGGEDATHQAREQWTDGSNAFTLSPGHFVLYSRNKRTISEFEARGYRVYRLHTAQPEDHRAALVQAGFATSHAVFAFSGSELSRARGGGRCLTMPLSRAVSGDV